MMRQLLLAASASIALAFFGSSALDGSSARDGLDGFVDPFQDTERSNMKTLVTSCKKCHADDFNEWSSSQHSKSWDNPVFQAAIATLEDKGASCARCHAPREVMDAGLGALPKGRVNDRELGVNCVTCHMKGNRYHGPFKSPGHGGVEPTPEFREVKVCASCHGQAEARKEHEQVSSFLANKNRAPTDTCQSCHMPAVQRKMVTASDIKDEFTIGVVECRKHTFAGARQGDMVTDSVDVKLETKGDDVVVTLTSNAGHSLPASSGRSVVLTVNHVDVGGKSVGTDSRPFSFPDGPVLKPGDPTEFSFKKKAGAATFEARLTQELLKVPGRDAPVVTLIGDAKN